MEDENKISSNIDNLTVTNSCLYESKKSMRGVSIGIIFVVVLPLVYSL